MYISFLALISSCKFEAYWRSRRKDNRNEILKTEFEDMKINVKKI